MRYLSACSRLTAVVFVAFERNLPTSHARFQRMRYR
jgi:hypothetical protein